MIKTLTADDSKTTGFQLKTELTGSDSNYDIIETHDGLNAIKLLNSNQYVKLITFDVNTPKVLLGLGGIKKKFSRP